MADNGVTAGRRLMGTFNGILGTIRVPEFSVTSEWRIAEPTQPTTNAEVALLDYDDTPEDIAPPIIDEPLKIPSLREAIEICIMIWSELAETGESYEDSWSGFDSLEFGYTYDISDNPLCDWCYRELNTKKLRNIPVCQICPYFILFNKRCRHRGSPYYKWQATKNILNKKKYAKAHRDTLLLLRKEIVLHPEKFTVKKRRKK